MAGYVCRALIKVDHGTIGTGCGGDAGLPFIHLHLNGPAHRRPVNCRFRVDCVPGGIAAVRGQTKEVVGTCDDQISGCAKGHEGAAGGGVDCSGAVHAPGAVPSPFNDARCAIEFAGLVSASSEDVVDPFAVDTIHSDAVKQKCVRGSGSGGVFISTCCRVLRDIHSAAATDCDDVPSLDIKRQKTRTALNGLDLAGESHAVRLSVADNQGAVGKHARQSRIRQQSARDVVVVGLCRRALDKCPGGQAVQNVIGQISGDRRLVKEADGVRIGSGLEQVVLDSQ